MFSVDEQFKISKPWPLTLYFEIKNQFILLQQSVLDGSSDGSSDGDSQH